MKKCINGELVEITGDELALLREKLKLNLHVPTLETRVEDLEQLLVGLWDSLKRLGILK